MASFKRCPRGLEIQTIIFPGSWSAREVRAWARSNQVRASKLDRTGSSVRLRQRSPRDFVQGSFRTITISANDDIKAVVGCPLPGRESDRRRTRRDVSRFDLSTEGKRWMAAYQNEGATPEVRDAFERLSRFDKAAVRFLLTENGGPPSSRDRGLRKYRALVHYTEGENERIWETVRARSERAAARQLRSELPEGARLIHVEEDRRARDRARSRRPIHTRRS